MFRATARLIRETAPARRSAPVLKDLPERKSFGTVIADRRLELGYRQEDLAREVGFTAAMLGKIENSQRSPDIKYLPAMAQMLRIDLSAFTIVFLKERAPQIYRALTGKSAIQQDLNSLSPAVRDTVVRMIGRLTHEELKRKRA
jgi:transcriptional regulator with XRE-family HTH domain